MNPGSEGTADWSRHRSTRQFRQKAIRGAFNSPCTCLRERVWFSDLKREKHYRDNGGGFRTVTMDRRHHFPLTTLNTFGVEAYAASYIRFGLESELIGFLKRPVAADRPFFILGGGSNLLLVEDLRGTVLHPLLKGIHVEKMDREHVFVRAMAGEKWDELVAFCVKNGWGGLENLSFIPGSVGASVVQNIGAYGVEVDRVVHRIEAVAMADGSKTEIFPGACQFGYRTSNFRNVWAGRYIITAVTFRLNRRPHFVMGYPGVQKAVAALGEVTLNSIRQAIIDIRKSKLPEPEEIGNAGSFFKNPVVASSIVNRLIDQFPDMPWYPHTKGRFKIAGGWLIEQCGLKGKRFGRSAVHDRQALVLVNRGGATGREILTLSEQVRAAVFDRFGIRLEREVQVVPEINGKLETENGK